MQRRTFITASALACLGWSSKASALDSEWWPYQADVSVRIEPALTQQLGGADYGKKISRLSQSSAPPVRSKLLPPRAYDTAGLRFNIDPWLIYGVALQESLLKFGERTLPYPWTLCVTGAGKRYGSYEAALHALRGYVDAQGIRNVDCGPMQVNWGWHTDKLQSFERALDPYHNLAVGAQILREHFNRQCSWSRAVALYHTGSDKDTATVNRGKRYSKGVFSRLTRMGLDAPSLLASKGWRRYVA